MCFFLTIAVPAASVDRVHAFAGRDFKVDPTTNPSAIKAAGPGYLPLLVTGGGCSCGWYAQTDPIRSEDHARRTRERYEKQGWSRAKIERAMASMVRPPRPDEGLHPVIVDFIARFLSEIGQVRLWVHDFAGKVEAEAYTTRRREPCSLSELAAHRQSVVLDEVWCVHE